MMKKISRRGFFKWVLGLCGISVAQATTIHAAENPREPAGFQVIGYDSKQRMTFQYATPQFVSISVYDSNGNLLEVRPNQCTTYSYTSSDAAKYRQDPDFTTAYVYDSSGKLLDVIKGRMN